MKNILCAAALLLGVTLPALSPAEESDPSADAPVAIADSVVTADAPVATTGDVVDAPAAVAGPETVGAKAPKKTPESERLRIEFSADGKTIEAYYSNASQARMAISSESRYDPAIAAKRDYHMLRLTAAGIAEPVRLDVDDRASVEALTDILDRFDKRSRAIFGLSKVMELQKAELEKKLSHEETRLVELRAAKAPDEPAIAKSAALVEEFKNEINSADRIISVPSLSGKAGTALLHLNRPPYEFVSELSSSIGRSSLKAGYRFHLSPFEVRYCINLLRGSAEFKERLVRNKAEMARNQEELRQIFADAGI